MLGRFGGAIDQRRRERWIDQTVERGIERSGFSARQAEVARLKCQGRTCAEIAYDLRLSENTVHNYLTEIYAKTETHGALQLLRFLLEAGARREEPPRVSAA